MPQTARKMSLGFRFDSSSCAPRVALIRKERPAWQKGMWNGIGGSVEPDESPISAMCREFVEETSEATLQEEWKHVLTLKSIQCNWEVHVFRSFGSLSSVKTTTDEKVSVFEVNNLPPNVITNLRWMVPLCLDDKDIDGPFVVCYSK